MVNYNLEEILSLINVQLKPDRFPWASGLKLYALTLALINLINYPGIYVYRMSLYDTEAKKILGYKINPNAILIIIK